MKRSASPLLALAVFLVNIWLNAPLFVPGELPFRGSIEGGYVGMARFLSAHPNPWGWNPLLYCGMPVQFMYVPALLYASAFGMHLLPHVPADTVYRTLVALLTCLGPVTLFIFALHFTRSRRWGFAAAIIYSLVSPSYGLFPAVEKDRGIVQLPWRIQVLAKYGEGPHNTGLTLLPLALLAVWLAGRRGGYPRIFGAAILLAAIPLTNWVAAFALAICCLLLLVAAWGEDEFRAWRAFAAAGLAWLLACFWLTPSFIRTIAFNWPADSFAYRMGDRQLWLIGSMAAGVVAIRVLFRLARGSFYFCLITLAAFVFGWISTAYYIYGVDTIPESRRYAIEFELFLTLALLEAFRLALRSNNSTVRLCAYGTGGVMLLVGAPQIWAYVGQGWQKWMPAAPESTVEYRLGRWLAEHPSEGRVFASGGLRFRLNSWFDVPQVGGGFETGLQNRLPVDLAYRIRSGKDLPAGRESEETLLDLKALGAQYVVVHGPKSREYYRDFLRPDRLSGLTAVYQTEEDTIFALPARPLAHVMDPAEIPNEDVRYHPDLLKRYVAGIEDLSRPGLKVQWQNPSLLTITGPVPAGKVLSVQINATTGWEAFQDGKSLAIHEDQIGFVSLSPSPAAETRIDLRYRGTAEQRIMALVSIATWLAAFAGLVLASKKGSKIKEHGAAELAMKALS